LAAAADSLASCSADLAIKKLGKPKHAKGVASVFESANTIINCIDDSSRVRWLVNEHQKDKYGKVCGRRRILEGS
jgi:hypothetical protein